MVDSSCELATYISPSPCGKNPFFQRSYFISTTTVYSRERGKKGVVRRETCPFEWSSKTVSKKLAGTLHDCRGYYWRTFPPGPFAMWNGNCMAELVLFGGPAVQADWAGFGWLVPLTPMLRYYLGAT